MSLWRIAWRYLWSRPLVTALSLISVTLGCALIASVLTLRRETEKAFRSESGYFDLVVGAKGSPLQLVLSSIYHLDIPTGNIPFARYEALKADTRVKTAIPIGLGDNYRNFRIVGTDESMFGLQVNDSESRKVRTLFQLSSGKFFDGDFQTVVGAEVARQTGLALGQEFIGTHGLVSVAGSEEHKAFPYHVVGILAPTGTSIDRAIYTTLNSVWAIHDKEAQLHGEKPRERQVTSVLIQLRSAGMRYRMTEEINGKTEAMAAIPVGEMLKLYQQILAPVQQTLLAMAALVVVVAALTILSTLYQAAERRRREVAVMRSLGAHPAEIFLLIILEAAALTLCGIAAGWVVGHGGVVLAGAVFQQQTGMTLSGWSVDRAEVYALGIVAIAGATAGLLPAWLTYRRSPVRDLTAS